MKKMKYVKTFESYSKINEDIDNKTNNITKEEVILAWNSNKQSTEDKALNIELCKNKSYFFVIDDKEYYQMNGDFYKFLYIDVDGNTTTDFIDGDIHISYLVPYTNSVLEKTPLSHSTMYFDHAPIYVLNGIIFWDY